jgi:hypothetical protein
MSSMQHLDVNWPTLAERVERCGRWLSWVGAEPALACASGLEEVALIVADRAHPERADALLAALVRFGAVDGGNDQDAAGALALLLANGAARLAMQLRDLSSDIDQMVAGQVWLQIREFPWRRRRRAIAANILMDARRALLRDLGVDTRIGSRGVVVIPVDTTTDAVATGQARAPWPTPTGAAGRATRSPSWRSWSGPPAAVGSPRATPPLCWSWPALRWPAPFGGWALRQRSAPSPLLAGCTREPCGDLGIAR